MVKLCQQICLILQTQSIKECLKLFAIHDGIYTMLCYTYSMVCDTPLRNQYDGFNADAAGAILL